MIHAYLFVTQRIRDHDGHGPEFQKHMDRINKGISQYLSNECSCWIAHHSVS